MTKNLIDLQWFADEGNVTNGSSESGTSAAANEELLTNAFGINTDADTNGKKPVAKPEGNTAAGGKDTGSETLKNKLAPWTDQLTQDMRDNPETAAEFAKFAKIPELAKAYLDLKSKAGGVVIPGKGATTEAVAEFWEKAGRPKAAEGYSFAKDKESDGATFAAAAFSANLTEAQARAMYKNMQEIGARNLQGFHDQLKQKLTQTAAELQKEYGSKYKENMEYLTRGLNAAGPNVAKLLANAGLTGEPEIVKAFISYGRMTAESGFTRGDGAGESMKGIIDGGSFEYKD